MCRVTETAAPRPAIDFSTFDQSIRIQDDLFRHVNGTWLNTTQIPADKPLTGAFMELRDQAEAAVRDIITTIESGEPGSDEARIADLYASFMDEEAVEEAGSDPVLPLLTAIDSVETLSDLTRMLGGFARQAVAGLVALQAEPDPGDPNRYVMFAANFMKAGGILVMIGFGWFWFRLMRADRRRTAQLNSHRERTA